MISEAAATMDISSIHPPLTSSKDSAGGRVQVIDRSIVLLRTLSGLKHGASALDLARLTGIDRTTIHCGSGFRNHFGRPAQIAGLAGGQG